ncbi:MAG: 3'(2'),5'-bisphosphate nucleotidase CysQ [Saprospiraceae bacterium]
MPSTHAVSLSALAFEVADIARRAGAVIMDIYRDEASFEVEHKADDSPLTRADKASNAVIVTALEQLDFQAPIISEENKQIAFEERATFTYCWMVDPLDGTKEFIKRNGEFTVNIALIHDGRVVMGVVYVPVTAELYWASADGGAFKSSQGNVSNLQAATFSMSDPHLAVVASRSHLNEATSSFIGGLQKPELVSVGSSLKLLLVAEGRAHLYPRLAPTMEWDTAAAQIIVEEAGGQVLQADNNEPVVYNKENLLNPHFIVSGKRV